MAKKNLSQEQIDRKKKIGAELTRATSAIGLGSLAAMGGAYGTRKLAGGKLLPKLNPAKARAFEQKVTSKLVPATVVASGIGGYNGFNAAAWQSAEARQRKSKVVKSAPPSPFEDGHYGSEGSSEVYLEEISKIGEWKTIDQRELSQRRSRKTMRHSGAAAGIGGGLVALGYHDGGDKAKYKRAGTALRSVNDWRATGEMRNKESLKAASGVGARTFKSLSHSGKIGIAAIAGATAAGGSAKAHHTYQQHKINQRRRSNLRKSAESAFGIVHD